MSRRDNVIIIINATAEVSAVESETARTRIREVEFAHFQFSRRSLEKVTPCLRNFIWGGKKTINGCISTKTSDAIILAKTCEGFDKKEIARSAFSANARYD